MEKMGIGRITQKRNPLLAPPFALSSLLIPETKHGSGKDADLMWVCSALFSF